MKMSDDEIGSPFISPDCPWVEVKPGSKVPENAFAPGGKLQGSPVYIGRVYDNGDYLIGTALPDKGFCLYLTRKQEVKSVDTYDILTADCDEPLQFLPMALDSSILFVSGGNDDEILYTSRVVDGENTYIGWANQAEKKVYIPRDSKVGPSVLEDNYQIMLHKFLPGLCVCPPRQVNPPF